MFIKVIKYSLKDSISNILHFIPTSILVDIFTISLDSQYSIPSTVYVSRVRCTFSEKLTIVASVTIRSSHNFQQFTIPFLRYQYHTKHLGNCRCPT